MAAVGPAFDRLAALVCRRPWTVVAVWTLLVLVALPLSRGLPARLQRGGGLIPGSVSAEVSRRLATDFANPFVDPQIVAMRSPAFTVHDAPFRDAIDTMTRALRADPGIRRVASPFDAGAGVRMVGLDGHAALLIVGARGGPEAAGDAVKRVREIVAPHLVRLREADPGMASGTTGPSAFLADVIGSNATDSAQAERRVMLPALLLLLWVFGSPVAAALPVVLGLCATLLTLAGACFIATHLTLNAYVQTAGTMLGLALGIDYALIMVSRYREERRHGLAGEAAIAATLRTAGWTVVTSGLVVWGALGVLVVSGMTEMVSVGVGGSLTVLFAVLLATTLLPALLILVGGALDAPHRFARAPGSGGDRWVRWGAFVTRWRWPAALLSLALLATLAAPIGHYRIGLPDGRWFPAGLEAVKGAEVLAAMRQTGLSFPVQIVVRREDGGPMLDPAGVRALWQLSRQLRADPRVADVLSPVDLARGQGLLAYLLFYASPERAIARHPAIGELFLSRERRSVLVEVVMKDEVPLSEAKAFVVAERAREHPGLTVLVGGTAANEVDLEARQKAFAPWALSAIFLATFCVLFLAFRSVLIPLKAIGLNLLAVLAATGLVVTVFQDGVGHALVGLPAPLSSVPLTLPMLMFCLTFGLSMDYEILMINRVAEARAIVDGEAGAIARGLGETGGVVTAAAAIMVLVFGAFVGVEMALVKMLGFGLAAAITLDATLIRGVLAPAALAIAGRWNWWPGER